MKAEIKKLLFLVLVIFTVAIVGCEDVDLTSHDHDGDGVPDHSAEEHSKDMGEVESIGDSEVVALPEVDSEVPMTELQKHNMPTDCWVVFEGSVFDITSYIERNPEAAELSNHCGTDGFEDAFKNTFGEDEMEDFLPVALFKGLAE